MGPRNPSKRVLAPRRWWTATYAHIPERPVGINTVYHQADLPSRLMLPLVPLAGASLGPELPCGAQEAVRAVCA